MSAYFGALEILFSFWDEIFLGDAWKNEQRSISL